MLIFGYLCVVFLETFVLAYLVHRDLELDKTMFLLCFLVSLTVIILPLFFIIAIIQELYFKLK